MRLLQGNGFAGFGLPVALEFRIVILIEVTGDIVTDIQQGGIGPYRPGHQRT